MKQLPSVNVEVGRLLHSLAHKYWLVLPHLLTTLIPSTSHLIQVYNWDTNNWSHIEPRLMALLRQQPKGPCNTFSCKVCVCGWVGVDEYSSPRT